MIGESMVDLRSHSLMELSVEEVAIKFSYLLKSQDKTSFI